MSAVGEGAPADPAAEAAAAAPPPEGAAGAAEGAAALVDAGDGAQTPLSTPEELPGQQADAGPATVVQVAPEPPAAPRPAGVPRLQLKALANAQAGRQALNKLAGVYEGSVGAGGAGTHVKGRRLPTLDVRWDPLDLNERTSLAVAVRPGDGVEQAAETLNLKAWINARKPGYEDGVQGIMTVIGNSDQLDVQLDEHDARMRDDPSYKSKFGGISPDVSAAEARSRLSMMFSRGLARAAHNVNAAVLTAGIDQGPVGFMGRAIRARGHNVPLVGVVPLATSTFPGDTRSGAEGRARVQEDHTHVVTLTTANEQSVTWFRFSLIEAILRRNAGPGAVLPVVGVVANGGDAAMEEALQCVRRGWPIVVVRGTGGTADAIAWARQREHASYFIPNPKLMEIVRIGVVETISITEADGKVLQSMLERLFSTMLSKNARKPKAELPRAPSNSVSPAPAGDAAGDGRTDTARGGAVSGDVEKGLPPPPPSPKGFKPPISTGLHKVELPEGVRSASHSAVIAWDAVHVYRANSAKMAYHHTGLTYTILTMGVLITTLVALRNDTTRISFGDDAAEGTDTLIFILPIVVTLLVSISSRFQLGLKSKVLTAAAEAVVKEIYTFRARVDVFADHAPDSMLSERFKGITERLSGTIIGETTLDTKGPVAAARRAKYQVSVEDDGFSVLPPDKYIDLRLVPTFSRYLRDAKSFDFMNKVFAGAVIVLGSAGSALAAFDLSIYVTVSTAIATAIQSLAEQLAYDPKITAMNKSSCSMYESLGWWRALTTIEQANPNKYNKLVKLTEKAQSLFRLATNPGSPMVEAESSGGQLKFSLEELIGDCMVNYEDSKMHFAKNWVEKYPGFFDAFKQYVCEAKPFAPMDNGDAPQSLLFDEADKYAKPEEKEGAKPEEKEGAKPEEEEGDSKQGPLPPDTFFAQVPAYQGETQSVGSILWDPEDFSLRTTPVVETSVGGDALVDESRLNLDAFLRDMQEWEGGVRGVVNVIGASPNLDEFLEGNIEGESLPDGISSEEAITRLRMVYSRGIVTAAADVHAAVLTGGFDIGPAGFAGRANLDREYVAPMIAVCSKPKMTWPGDVRPGQEERLPLQPDHTHVVMVPSADEEHMTSYKFELAHAMSVDDQTGSRLPAVAFVVNGGSRALQEVLECVRLGWPIVIIRGSGGVADRLHAAIEAPELFVSDAVTTEIVQEGTIEFIELSEVDGGTTVQMIKRLFVAQEGILKAGIDAIDPSLALAWDRLAEFADNAAAHKRIAKLFRDVSIFLAVLATALAATKEALALTSKADEPEFKDASEWLGHIVVVVPLILGVVSAVALKLRSSAKAGVLLLASERIRSNIFRYRTRTGEFSAMSPAARNRALVAACKSIGAQVLESVVAEGGLDQSAVQRARANMYRFSKADDGVSMLNPEDYIQNRIYVQIAEFDRKARQITRTLNVLSVLNYVLGAAGTALAIFGGVAQLYVTVTVAISAAMMTVAEAGRYEEKLLVYNRATTHMRNMLSWWLSNTDIEKANPQKYARLVNEVEEACMEELQVLARASASDDEYSANSGMVLDFEELRADLADAADVNGDLLFKKTWMVKHQPFFDSLLKFMLDSNQIRHLQPTEIKPKPPLAENIQASFLHSSVITKSSPKTGAAKVAKWLVHLRAGGTLEEWRDGVVRGADGQLLPSVAKLKGCLAHVQKWD